MATMLIGIASISCAKPYYEDSDALYQRVLEAWIRVNYPECVENKTESGVYILEYTEGSGKTAGDEDYVFAHYVKYNLSGSVSSTNSEDLSQRLGSYSNTDYYGSDIWQLGQEYLPEGIEEILKGVKVGSHFKIALPVAASYVGNPTYNAFSSASSSDNLIIDLVIDDCVSDIDQYEIDMMENFKNEKWPLADSLVNGFYYLSIGSPSAKESEADTLADSESINIRYVGKLLNGQVFDTNIEDTAKKYRIYDPSNEYSALAVTYYKDLDDFIENNSVVEGFARAIVNMEPGEKSITFFSSDYGYGDAGSNNSIPEYSPLFFYIQVEDPD